MTAKKEQSIKRLRERLDESDDISDTDAAAVREMSDRIRLLGSSELNDQTHEKYLMRCVKLAEEVGGLSKALEDRDAAERLVRWINREQNDSAENNKTYRSSLRQFGRLATDGDDIPESLEWIPGGYPKNYDPAPNPGDMLRWDEDILPMVEECHNLRDKALITLAWDLGPRPYELFDLTLGQFSDSEHGMKVTLDGKTGRRSPTIIPSTPHVRRWLNVHPGSGDPDAPFISRKNTPEGISNNRVRDILKEKARQADVTRPVTPSNFRKSSASYLASQGVSQAHLEDHHGWTRGSDIAARYVSVFDEANAREIARAHGVDVEEETPDPIAPVPCPRCGNEIPRGEKFCGDCGQAQTPTATEAVDAQEDRLLESAAASDGDLAEDILELRDLLDEKPALRAVLLGEGT